MKRRNFLKTIGLSIALPAINGCSENQVSAANKSIDSKPNIIFILIDDLGYKDVGFTGSQYYETPTIDALAKKSMIFTNAYSNGPNCAPTRGCLLSGMYSPRHGIYTVSPSARGKSINRKLIPIENNPTLPASFITMAEPLKAAGYTTASMGKWHVGEDETGPLGQGFDVNIGGTHAGHPKSYFSPYKNSQLSDGPKGEYLTDRITDEAVKFITSNSKKPFFLYLPHYAVHTPIQARKELIEKYKNKPPHNGQKNPKYAAMVESVDLGIARITKTLDHLGISENTVIIFTSDNGGHGMVTSMLPLRGSKGMLYEGGIRVPTFVHWPGKVKPNTTCDTPIISLDFYPTLLEMTNTPKPKGLNLDGQSIVPMLKQTGDLTRDAIYWHFPAYLASYNRQQIWRTTPCGAVRSGDFKLIEFFEDGSLELYNLKDDISEKNNLAKTMPEKTKQMYKMLTDWRAAVNAPIPTELNPEYKPK